MDASRAWQAKTGPSATTKTVASRAEASAAPQSAVMGERNVMENDAPTVRTSDHVNFSAPASLRKWPSLGNQRSGEAANPYLVLDGTLNDCLRKLMSHAASTRHLYEIHTAPQPPWVREVMAGETVAELARLRDLFEPLAPTTHASAPLFQSKAAWQP
jgi:hypothetical protein